MCAFCSLGGVNLLVISIIYVTFLSEKTKRPKLPLIWTKSSSSFLRRITYFISLVLTKLLNVGPILYVKTDMITEKRL